VLYTARTTAICNVIRVGNRVSLNHRPVDEGVVDHGRIHADHGSVVGEESSPPLAAGEAYTEVPTAIIDAAVIAHLRPPISLVIRIEPVRPSPVTGRPQGADVGRRHPCAGNPIVVAIAVVVGPIAWRPHHVWRRAYRWLVDGQYGRRKPHTD
jgi:hypothetical protein